MTLKLHGFPISTCTRRVAVVAKEKNVPYEFVSVDLLNGEHKGAAYLAKQPFGQVPYIDDEGFELFESRAIARYIATKWAAQGTPLIPTGLKAQSLFEQAASIEQNDFDSFASGYCAEKVFNPRKGIPTNEERAAWLLTTLEAKLDAYDKILSKQKYLAGDEITLADLFHLPYGAMLIQLGQDVFSPRPNVSRWWNEISSRPSWQAVKDSA
ncbi:glutathione S-transferase-like protein [Dentipellis sp. KUC8613]|nr:glutathione S-transferase-like protein [Dentipellis sp. KUC8613]